MTNLRHPKMMGTSPIRIEWPPGGKFSRSPGSARAHGVATYLDRTAFQGISGHDIGAAEAPGAKISGICRDIPSLLGPFAQPETPHLNKNQSFENTQRHKQHDHKLLVCHISFSSNSATRRRGDLSIPCPPRRCSSHRHCRHPIMYRLRGASFYFR